MLKAYKYRIYPTKDQEVLINKTIGICRLVYNLALETKIRSWQSIKKNLSGFDLINQLPELKEAYPWMKDVDSQALQASVRKLDASFTNFFKGAGYPKFKSKKDNGSFQCPSGIKRINWADNSLTIPKISNIPIAISKRFDGKIKTITISRVITGKYFASILVDDEIPAPIKPSIASSSALGVDLGIKSFAVTSDGKFFEPNRKFKESLGRLKCLQRRAARKKKGSNNRKKANKKAALLHEKIADQRFDYIHKITSQLIRDNQAETFVIEDLAVGNLLKNSKLSRAISDVAWGEFIRQLKYKCDWYGKNLIVIDRFAPSSKRCSDCGKIKDELTLADREWTCECGATHDRDLNAAKNIKFFGLNTPVGSREGPVESRRLRRAKKQEKC